MINIIGYFSGIMCVFVQVGQRMKALFGRHVQQHKDTYEEGHLRDVIDVYLKERGLNYDSEKLIGLFASVVGK